MAAEAFARRRPRRVTDVVGQGLAWLAGGFFCLVFGAIVVWLAVQAASVLSLSFLTDAPTLDSAGRFAGGISQPIVGTIIITLGGTLVALPLGVAIAVFLVEYRRPAWLATAVEMAVEVVFGIPAIVIAICGLSIFAHGSLGFLSNNVSGSGHAFGKSFLVGSIAISLIALPPIVRSVSEALRQVPRSLREASYAVGKTRSTTIRRLVLPSVRPGMLTGTIIGMGRIAGDTAIAALLLGATFTFTSGGHWWRPDEWSQTLRGSGPTLTSYIYCAAPSGECNSDTHAYGAAFVLVFVILALNAVASLVLREPRWKRAR